MWSIEKMQRVYLYTPVNKFKKYIRQHQRVTLEPGYRPAFIRPEIEFPHRTLRCRHALGGITYIVFKYNHYSRLP